MQYHEDFINPVMYSIKTRTPLHVVRLLAGTYSVATRRFDLILLEEGGGGDWPRKGCVNGFFSVVFQGNQYYLQKSVCR